MPKPEPTGRLFPESKPEPENQPLVNQSGNAPADDIPFGNTQNGDAGAAPPITPPPAEVPGTATQVEDYEQRIHQLEARVTQLTEERDSALEAVEASEAGLARANKANQELLAKGGATATATALNEQGAFRRQCFFAVLQGMAAHGDLSLGKLTSDTDTQKAVRHAAGIAAFAAASAKEARLI